MYICTVNVYTVIILLHVLLGLPHNETTIAEYLKEVGYSTAIVGKWHLGVGANNEYLPTNHGFDQYYVSTYLHTYNMVLILYCIYLLCMYVQIVLSILLSIMLSTIMLIFSMYSRYMYSMYERTCISTSGCLLWRFCMHKSIHVYIWYVSTYCVCICNAFHCHSMVPTLFQYFTCSVFTSVHLHHRVFHTRMTCAHARALLVSIPASTVTL